MRDETLASLNPFNSIKSLVWREAYEDILAGKIPKPVSATLDISNICDISCSFCCPKDTKILMADFTWKNIQEIQEGEDVVGYRGHLFVSSKVKKTFKRNENKFVSLQTENNKLTVTYGHEILKVDKHNRRWWISSQFFKLDDGVKAFPFASCKINEEYKRGYLAGVAIGDGCFWIENRTQHHFRLAAKDMEIKAKAIETRAKEIENEVLSKSGMGGNTTYRDFSNKEVYLLLLDNIDKKLDVHIEWCRTMTDKYIPEFNKQSQVLAQVCKELPDKGFCDKVGKMYDDLYPEGTEEPNLPQKVNLLWNDRRWVKGILYFLVSIGVIDFILLIGRYVVMGNF